MSNDVLILKTAEYNPIYDGPSKYESLDLITTFQFSPGITHPKKVISILNLDKLEGVQIIVHSSLRRARETAKAISSIMKNNSEILESNALDEVRFSLKNLVSAEEYEKNGSNLVRQRFIEAFIEDALLEKRGQIFGRILTLGRLLRGLNAPDGKKILCVSHSFFMKILAVFLKEPKFFDSPVLLRKYFNPKKRTFEFCQGFEFDPAQIPI